jgi:hypothetical protein
LARLAWQAEHLPCEHELCPVGSDRALDTALIAAPDARSRIAQEARCGREQGSWDAASSASARKFQIRRLRV